MSQSGAMGLKVLPLDEPVGCCRGNGAWIAAALIAMTLAVLTAVLWPGEISWINDEPRLLNNAYDSNQEHVLAEHGLKGNFGITYGPTGTQCYQPLLLITHDPLKLVMLRAGINAGVTMLGLIWLGWSLRLNPGFAIAVSLAPFLWVFHRIMWDASWAIPIGALGLGAHASFLRNGSPWPLTLAVFCALMNPFIHPQGLPLTAAVLLHLTFRRFPAVIKYLPFLIGAAVLVYFLNRRYLWTIPGEIEDHLKNKSRMVYPGTDKLPKLMGVATPFLGGRILGGHGYMDGAFPFAGLGIPIILAKIFSHIVYGLVWCGIVAAVIRWVHRARGVEVAPATEAAASGKSDFWARNLATPSQAIVSMSGVCLTGLLIMLAIFGLKRVPPDPQYFFGTFALHACLAWLGVEAIGRWLPRIRAAGTLVLLYGLSCAAITLISIYLFHIVNPGQDLLHPPAPLPTLNKQVDLAKALNTYTDAKAYTTIEFFQNYPQSLRGLRKLVAAQPGQSRAAAGPLLIRFATRADGTQINKLEVVELKDISELPKDAKEMEIGPLPRWWEPRG